MNFDKSYWEKNYSEPMEMDGIANSKEHALYLKSLFDLEMIDISSIADLGFGLGFLFKEICQVFLPYKILGIEPSEHAFNKVNEKFMNLPKSTKLKLKNISIEQWCEMNEQKYYDLGICTSVFQYLPKQTLLKIMPVLSKRLKYLYLSVPTDKELKRQREEIEFNDKYAKRRSQKFYHEIISPYFSVVGCRLLESKYHFTDKNTLFTDLYYRF